MVIATIGGITALVLGITKVTSVANEITASDNVTLPGTETVAGSGSQFTVWSTSSFANCTVNGGDTNFDTSASTNQSTDAGGESFNLVGWFDTSSGQDYTVECDGSPGETFSVIEVSFSALATGIGLLVGSFVGGFGLFVIGLIFVIIALFRRSSWKKSHGMGPGGYQPGPGQPAPGQQAWAGQPQAAGPPGWNPPPGGQAPPSGDAPTAPGGPPPPPTGPPPAPGAQGGAPPPPPPPG